MLQFTMLLPFKYVNDPNWLKTTKSIFMLDLWVSFNTCTKSEDLVNALYMYLEDYSLARAFFLLCPRNCLFMYLLSYCHRYLFIYLFIYWACLSLWFQCKLDLALKLIFGWISYAVYIWSCLISISICDIFFTLP